ncbi:plexin b1 [Cichlidogyrus casuarinus]|uniref:Plexin b1 n=1 Tax=Cichlidogyrus casuarinus TaxID=1844966 RepID=A0ABD2QNL5_9PLAT
MEKGIEANFGFRYTLPPIVDKSLAPKMLSLFASGGNEVRLPGKRLEVIHRPELLIYNYNQPGNPLVQVSCSNSSNDYMCQTPKLNESQTELFYGLKLDNVSDYRHLGNVQVFPDPVLVPFTKGLQDEFVSDEIAKLMETDSTERSKHWVQFHGMFPGSAEEFLYSDTWVNIGDSHCSPIKVTPSKLLCEIDVKGFDFEIAYPVRMHINKRLTFEPGHLQFRKKVLTFKLKFILGFSGVLILIVIVAIVSCWGYCNQRTKKITKLKVNNLLNAHEIDKKNVCDAISDEYLKTKITPAPKLESRIVNSSKFPVRDFRLFYLFTLFPKYHEILAKPIQPSSDQVEFEPEDTRATIVESIRLALDQDKRFTLHWSSVDETVHELLLELIFDSDFLIESLNTLENVLFDINSKVRMIALLSLILQQNMFYFTKVMLEMLSHLITKRQSIEDRRNALREVGHLAVKLLSNWFMCLQYEYLRSVKVSGAFYQLYRAMQEFINQGQQDAVTGKTAYFLDDSNLLKIALPRPDQKLRVLVRLQDWELERIFGIGAAQTLTMTLLSSDTVSQAKQKILAQIYGAEPYSKQIKPDQVYLCE